MTHSVCDRVAPYQALGYEEIVPSRFIQERVDLNQWDQLTPFNQDLSLTYLVFLQLLSQYETL